MYFVFVLWNESLCVEILCLHRIETIRGLITLLDELDLYIVVGVVVSVLMGLIPYVATITKHIESNQIKSNYITLNQTKPNQIVYCCEKNYMCIACSKIPVELLLLLLCHHHHHYHHHRCFLLSFSCVTLCIII